MDRAFPQAILLTLFGTSVIAAAADGYLYYRDWVGAERFLLVWTVVFSFLVAMWIDADSRGNPAIYRPYDYGFLIYLIWPLYLPYYLIRTRGLSGLAWLAAFVILFFLSAICRLVIWYGA